jgi:hypothetical protein
MHSQRKAMAWINVIGGVAVLGSYAHGIATHPDPGVVWGGVPLSLQPVYTVSMLAAAVGYLVFTWVVFFRIDPATARLGTWPAYPVLNGLYVAALLPSALWMPLTFSMLAAPSAETWFAVRLVLTVVGLAALGLIWALARIAPAPGPAWRIAAIAGAIAFANQTALLDALVWPAYFPR